MATSSCKALSGSEGAALAIGIGCGAAIGVALDDVAMGISIGVAIGIALGAGAHTYRRKRPPRNNRTDR